MRWDDESTRELSPILDQIHKDLSPLDRRTVCVLCSGYGDLALWLGHRAGPHGKIVGYDLNEELLDIARMRAEQEGLSGIVEFRDLEMYEIPSPDERFDALVSEFIIYPAPEISKIGQPEMARVLKPGGKLILTDVILTRTMSRAVENHLDAIGLDYLCEGTADDFRRWMRAANLRDTEILDFTPLVRSVWQHRRARHFAQSPEQTQGYDILLDHPEYALGRSIFYLYIRATKARVLAEMLRY